MEIKIHNKLYLLIWKHKALFKISFMYKYYLKKIECETTFLPQTNYVLLTKTMFYQHYKA